MKISNKFMFGGLQLALIWYGTTLCTLIFAIVFLLNLTYPRSITSPSGNVYQQYKALPAEPISTTEQGVGIDKIDARTLIITNFFKSRKAPLSDLATKFIDVADKYNLDYRLLPSIAMQESNGGKRMPANSFNPFGYGIYGSKITRFESFEEAIETVAKGLKNNYIDQGLQTPEQIMVKYTPPSLQKGGAWALGVSAFMEQLL